MENNELMNWEETEIMDGAVVENAKSGLGTGAAMLIGAGVAVAVGATAKLVKRFWMARKAKLEQQKNDNDARVDYTDIDEVADK